MEIRAHLSDAELMEALSNPGRGLLAHLDVCEPCRTEVGRLRRALDAGLLDSAPPEHFWERQRLEIAGRVPGLQQAQARAVPKLAWAALAAILAVGTLWINYSGRPPQPQASPVQVDDQELMLAVERTMQTDVPEALAPASLLEDEGLQPTTSNSTSQVHHGGNLHEN